MLRAIALLLLLVALLSPVARSLSTECVTPGDAFLLSDESEQTTSLSNMLPFGLPGTSSQGYLVSRVVAGETVTVEVVRGAATGFVLLNKVTISGLFSGVTEIVAIRQDTSSNLFLTGNFQGNSGQAKQVFIAKLDQSFSLVWVQLYNNTDPSFDATVAAADLTDSGDLVIAGTTLGLLLTNMYDAPYVDGITPAGFVARIDSQTGSVVWHYQEQAYTPNGPTRLKCKALSGLCYAVWRADVQSSLRTFQVDDGSSSAPIVLSKSSHANDGEIIFLTSAVLVAFVTTSTTTFKDSLKLVQVNSDDSTTSLITPISMGGSQVTNNVVASSVDSLQSVYLFGRTSYSFSSGSQTTYETGFAIKIDSTFKVHFTINLASQGGLARITSGFAFKENVLFVGGMFSGTLLNATSAILKEFLAPITPQADLYSRSCSASCSTSCPVAGTGGITCNSGVFGNGTCACPQGYTGSSCQTAITQDSVTPTQSATFPVWAQALTGALGGVVLLAIIVGGIFLTRFLKRRSAKGKEQSLDLSESKTAESQLSA